MSVPADRTLKAPVIEHRKKFEGHNGAVKAIVHLPGAGGQRIITCSMDGSLRVWNLENGEQIGSPWRDGQSGLSTIALSPDATKLVTGGQDGAMKLWDIKTGKLIARWTGHMNQNAVASVCWSRDGKKVLSGSWDGTAREWDAKSGETVLGSIETGIDRVQAVIYSPDTTLIATSGHQYGAAWHLIKIWDSKTGVPVATLKGHTNGVPCLAWTADGKTLISGSHDHSIRKWNTSTWRQIAVLTKHTGNVFALALSPNGRILASVSQDKTARLWDIEMGHPISSPLHHAQLLNCVSFSVDGKQLATGCADKNIYTWDVSAIVKQAGLEDLLSDNVQNKSVLDAGPTQLLNDNDTHSKLPQGFFDDARDHVHSSTTRPPLHSSPPRPSSALRLLGRFSSLFYHSQRPPALDVPYTRGLARNVRVGKAKEKKKSPIAQNIMTINVAPPSQPPNSAEQHSSGAAQGQQPPSQPQVSLTTPAATAITAMSVTEAPSPTDIVIRRAGCWTRVRLFLCCISVENPAISS